MSDYSFTCSCGEVHSVPITKAGSQVPCVCGRDIDVPRMSQLRKMAGETPIPLTTVETIESMIRRCELPASFVCPITTTLPDLTIEFRIICEEPWLQGSGPIPSWVTFISTALFGLIGYILTSRKTDDREIVGREVTVNVPLRISSSAFDQIAKITNQKALKKLLRGVPIYDQLLRQYPKAHVSLLSERDPQSTAI